MDKNLFPVINMFLCQYSNCNFSLSARIQIGKGIYILYPIMELTRNLLPWYYSLENNYVVDQEIKLN